MRLALDADSMSPRLSNATLSQDLDGELLAMSISNLCVPSQQTSSSRHDSTLTRSASARTIRLTPNVAPVGATMSNLLSPPANVAMTRTTSTSPCRRLTRSTSCPLMLLPLHLSQSPSFLLHALPSSTQRHARRFPGSAVVTTTKVGKGRSQFDSDVDLHREYVSDLPVIATTDFPDFFPEQSATIEVSPSAGPATGAQLTVEEVRKSTTLQRYSGTCGETDVRLLTHFSSYRSCCQRAPQLVQIKCLQWLNSLDQGAV